MDARRSKDGPSGVSNAACLRAYDTGRVIPVRAPVQMLSLEGLESVPSVSSTEVGPTVT